MVRYEILIKLNDEMLSLDTYDVDPIQLNFNIADIKDISSRNSSYSKTITIPETGKNRQIFNDIGDLNNEGDFNPNLKTEAWVLVDTIVVFKGFLQLRNVVTDLETGKRDYEIVIYAQNDNFFKEIGDSMLTDLDYSELNHVWNKENIVNSWTATTDNQGYYYPLIDYGYNWNLGSINGFNGQQANIDEMYPATNAKYLWDKIFANAGYTYESEFINSDVFKNLYIPFNQQNFTRGGIEDTTQYFSVGMTGDTAISTISNINIPALILNPFVNLGLYRIPFTNESSPYGDPDDLYNISTFEYEAPSVGFISQRFVCDFDITFRHGLQISDTTPLGFIGTNIRFKRSKNPLTGVDVAGGVIIPVNGSVIPIQFTQNNIPSLNIEYFGPSNDNDPVRVRGQISTSILDNTPSGDGRFNKLYPGEKLWVEVNVFGVQQQIRADESIVGNNAFTLNAGYGLFTANTQNVLFNVLEEVIVAEELYPYLAAIPKKFKQKDFITSIIKMFNLYVEPSKEFDKTLIIEPRDQFYQLGEVKDWTKKLDTTQPLNIQILGDTQNNEIKLTYKKDSDFYNEDYFNIRTDNEVYGEFSKFLENDFISGTRKVEPEFAATPLIGLDGGDDKFIFPQIYKVDNSTVKRSESKPRILTRFYSSTKEPWGYDDFIFYSDSGQPNNAKVMLSTSGFTDVPHNFIVGDVVTITQSDGGVAQPWLTGTFEIVEIPDIYSIVLDKFFVGPGGPAVAGIATPTDGLVGLGAQSQNGALYKWRFEGTDYSLYPYLGHFSHPLRPSYDINFGQTDGLYYETNVVTNNNLYEVYWKNAIEELMDKSSRIITGNFYLNAQDIADFKFSDTIFIDGQYYKVNKITYDPTKTITSNVELIKTNYVTVPIQQSITILPEGPIRNPNGTPVLNPLPAIPVRIKPGNISTSSTNNIKGVDNIVTGKNNNVFGIDNYVSGIDNVISGKNNMVTGSGNTIDSSSEKILIIGDNNIVESGITNSVIFGQGLTVTESNTVVVPNLEIDGDITTDTNNIVIVSNNSLVNDTASTNIFNAILGGAVNFIDECQASTILGGGNNYVESSTASSVLGGGNNFVTLFSIDSGILLGANNRVTSAIDSVILGGDDNEIVASSKSVILGGELNLDISSINSSIIGGNANQFTTSTFNSSIIGGDTNLIDGAAQSSIIAGSNNIIEANTAAIIASNTSSILNSSTGGVIIGGSQNEVDNSSSSVFAGSQNDILNSTRCYIGGGLSNFITTSSESIINGGQLNEINTSSFSAIIGGLSNTISSGVFRSVILGGTLITATQNDTVYVPNLVVVDSITPTGTADAQGVEGQITWDDDYVYVKTSVGWKRSALSTF